MDFVDELKADLVAYEKALNIMYDVEVFTFEERRCMEYEIKRIEMILSSLGVEL